VGGGERWVGEVGFVLVGEGLGLGGGGLVRLVVSIFSLRAEREERWSRGDMESDGRDGAK
jgi:hypothetical protein